MKKLFLLTILLASSCAFQFSNLQAQATLSATDNPVVQLDEKTQKKVDQAKVDLAKDQQKLTKTTAKYEKDKANFEKDERKGKLSPDKIAKEKKHLDQIQKEIGKLKKAIADNQELLSKFK